MNQLTIMLMVPDRARADIMLKADRIYYRFTTESSDDEGDLPGLKERFSLIAQRILEDIKPLEEETPADPKEIKVSAFADNVAIPTNSITEQAIKRLVDELLRIDDSFSLLMGFV